MQRVAVIGAGFAGLCMAIGLKRAGIHDFTVYERAADLGGVWRDNTYPGAGCDIPSVLYSYSFAQNGRWTRAYPRGAEILAYLRECAERFGVLEHVRFGAGVLAADWDDSEECWRLTVDGPDGLDGEHTARVLVSGVGQLGVPKLPDVPGIPAFGGTAFHSAQWDHGHDLTGRRVAVIGTGPSAVQFVPEIAPLVQRLTVFQRSANWVLPKGDRETGGMARRLRWLRRGAVYAKGETALYGAVRQRRWRARAVEAVSRRHLRRQVADTVLRAQLTPSFPLGCKRVLVSDDWYPALARDNVELVTAPINRIRKDGIETADGRHYCVDTLVYSTGFHATEFLHGVAVTGRDGVRLHDVWKDGAAAHLGLTVPGFPNLYLLYGPGTNLGHNSIVYMIESQAEYVLRHVLDGRTHEVTPADFDTYQQRLEQALHGSVFEAGCDSWYRTATGRVVSNWPLHTYRYRRDVRRAP